MSKVLMRFLSLLAIWIPFVISVLALVAGIAVGSVHLAIVGGIGAIATLMYWLFMKNVEKSRVEAEPGE